MICAWIGRLFNIDWTGGYTAATDPDDGWIDRVIAAERRLHTRQADTAAGAPPRPKRISDFHIIDGGQS